MNLIEELYTIDTEEYAAWMQEWWTEQQEALLNKPHWGMADDDPEVSDEFLPALLWFEPEHY